MLNLLNSLLVHNIIRIPNYSKTGQTNDLYIYIVEVSFQHWCSQMTGISHQEAC